MTVILVPHGPCSVVDWPWSLFWPFFLSMIFYLILYLLVGIDTAAGIFCK